MSLPMLKDEVREQLTKVLNELKYGDGVIVETGTGWGESAVFFAEQKPDWVIYTIDGFGLYGDGRIYSEWDADKVKAVQDKLPGNVIQILADLQKPVPLYKDISLLYIDADHTYQGCMNDFFNFSPLIIPGGYICFDDYTQENNPSNGVRRLVDEVRTTVKDWYEVVYEGYYCVILKKIK